MSPVVSRCRNVCIPVFNWILLLIYRSLSSKLAKSEGAVFAMVGGMAPGGI